MKTIKTIKIANIVNNELKLLYPNIPETPLNYSNPWELVVAVILSAQCTDVRVNLVTETLFIKYPTIESYAQANREEFEQDIKSTGFFRNKAKSIISAAQYLLRVHEGKLPQTMEELTKLPGVGRKTANVILGELFQKFEGIAVDTHILRLCRKFGISQTKSAEILEKLLLHSLPKEDWWGFGSRLKHYGRDYSPAKLNTVYSDPISLALIKEGWIPVISSKY